MSKSIISDVRLCFCGSGNKFAACCAPVIAGEKNALTAEMLMRSRYTAYVLEDEAYLLSSWHAGTRPESLNIQSGLINWTGLTISGVLRGKEGDVKGQVSFIATYEQAGVIGKAQENSRFLFENGRWCYLDGHLVAQSKPGRNAFCPCGSGKKYKKCCGR
jgi:SEC-C motif domain protein